MATEHWSEQYEETAKQLKAEADDATPGESVGLLNRAADDILTLVDGLKRHEEAVPFSDGPRYESLDDLKKSNLPTHVEFPRNYFPKGIGPGSFDPQMLYLHALALQVSMIHESMQKSWMIIWLLDHIDWDKIRETHITEWPTPNEQVID